MLDQFLRENKNVVVCASWNPKKSPEEHIRFVLPKADEVVLCVGVSVCSFSFSSFNFFFCAFLIISKKKNTNREDYFKSSLLGLQRLQKMINPENTQLCCAVQE